MNTAYSKQQAYTALLSGEREVRCVKTKQNKKGGAFLPDGSRAPDRGKAELVVHSEKAIQQFYAGR
jgi:hypothetical protein